MKPEQIALAALVVNSLITIIGWTVTAFIQKRILKETKKNQQLERELAVFRERIKTVQGIISYLIDASMSYMKLTVMLRSGRFNFEEGTKLLQALDEKDREFTKTIFDPTYRSIRDLLPKAVAESLGDQLTYTLDLLEKFHTSQIGLKARISNLNSVLQDSGEKAYEISQQLMKTADIFAAAFAYLDKILATGQISNPAKKASWLSKKFAKKSGAGNED